ncbi:NAD(P)-dependent oxidoreductase [Enterovibrio sp. 27052020O]|uniref:NAD(P)-dependent oxidoreductase n=1 Tax=Enterovibrio sp. 27052020O TaxID=3241166 RepID=UPI00388D842F
MHIGFIGLGRMGWLMAANLAREGVRLSVWNRSEDKSRSLTDAFPNVSAAKTPAQVASTCDVVFTMLANDDAVKSVYLEEQSGLGAITIQHATHWVEMSTISPALSEELSDFAKTKGVNYIDAPVSGSVNAAEAGELVFMLGSDNAVPERVQRCFSIMGKAQFLLGSAGRGHAAKLLINSVIHSQNQIVGEILALAASCHVDQKMLMTLLGESAAGSPMIRFRTPLYLGESDAVTFSLHLAKKDMALVADMAKQQDWSLAQIKTNLQQLEAAEKQGWGESDMAAIAPFLASQKNQ